jgi:hypothetical protein
MEGSLLLCCRDGSTQTRRHRVRIRIRQPHGGRRVRRIWRGGGANLTENGSSEPRKTRHGETGQEWTRVE